MVQVLPKVSGFGEQMGQALGGLAGYAGGTYVGNKLKSNSDLKAYNEQNDIYKGLTGRNLSRDPDIRKIEIASALKGDEKRRVFEQKQEALNAIYSGQGNQQNMGSRLASPGQQRQPPFMNEEQIQSQGTKYDPSTISDAQIAQITALDPPTGRELRNAKDAVMTQKRFERKQGESERKASPEFKREERIAASQAEADVKYNQNLQETSKQHELKEKTLDRLEVLNKKGVTGKPYEKLLEKAGLINLTSDGRREFAADVKNLITDIRSILGGQFSNFEFQTILNAYPSADFSKEANEAIIKNLKEFQDIKTKEVKFAEQLKKQNGGKIPQDFQAQVNEMVREYASQKAPQIKANAQKIMAEEYGITPGNILMLDPQGEPLDVSPNDVERYQSLGAMLP